MSSINGKITQAHSLAVQLGEMLNTGLEIDEGEIIEMIWGHADGISARRLYNLRDGICSLKETMEFDIEGEEKKLDADITLMISILESA